MSASMNCVREGFLFSNFFVRNALSRQFHATDTVLKTKAGLRHNQNIRLQRKLERVAHRVQGLTRQTAHSEPSSLVNQVVPLRGRRQGDHLSRIFSDHINQLLQEDHFSPLEKLGFHVSEVKLSSDLKELNIHWAAFDAENDAEIESMLEECAKELRQRLSTIPFIGLVPKVLFIREDSGRQLGVVEELLKVADFGPDFTPTEAAAPLRSPSEIQSLSASELRRSLSDIAQRFSDYEVLQGPGGSQQVIDSKELVDKLEVSLKTYPEELQAETDSENVHCDLNLRSDMYDINHDAIMSQVMHTKKRVTQMRMRSRSAETAEPSGSNSSANEGQQSIEHQLNKFRRMEGSRSQRKPKLVERRSHGKRNLSMHDMDTIL